MDLPAWTALYHALPLASRLTSETEESEVFRLKQGLPVKVGSTKRFLKTIPNDPKFFNFFQDHEMWFMVPVALFDGTIQGFLTRGYGKFVKEKMKYSLIAPNFPGRQLFFGWEQFASFRQGDPIVITEGSKDAIVLQTAYPHVLALLGANLTSSGLDLLGSLTKTLLLALDSDENGLRAATQISLHAAKRGITAKEVLPPEKDWGNAKYVGTEYLRAKFPFSR